MVQISSVTADILLPKRLCVSGGGWCVVVVGSVGGIQTYLSVQLKSRPS